MHGRNHFISLEKTKKSRRKRGLALIAIFQMKMVLRTYYSILPIPIIAEIEDFPTMCRITLTRFSPLLWFLLLSFECDALIVYSCNNQLVSDWNYFNSTRTAFYRVRRWSIIDLNSRTQAGSIKIHVVNYEINIEC